MRFFTATVSIPVSWFRFIADVSWAKECSLLSRTRGEDLTPSAVPDPSIVGNLDAEHGRGILLMRWLMDEVSFEFGFWGTEVHMLKKGDGAE